MGIISGTIIKVTKGDTRSLDCSSHTSPDLRSGACQEAQIKFDVALGA